jgi:hypothetical protein
MYMVLPQIEEEIALKEPGSAIVGAQRELTWISLYVFGRETGISIVGRTSVVHRPSILRWFPATCCPCEQCGLNYT